MNCPKDGSTLTWDTEALVGTCVQGHSFSAARLYAGGPLHVE